ncbi:MAG TPA: pilin [Candidatus Saccharimonadales bacterium]|nr:pilin [Candidatus Saccharimonadales bacterium]
MNTLALALTAIWMHAPAYRLADASADQNNLCTGAGLGSCHVDNGVVVDSHNTALTSDLTNNVKTIIETLLTVAGAVAVLIIVVAGLRYITSGGDATSVKQSKDTLLYAIVGLVIVILAYAIVNFVSTNV